MSEKNEEFVTVDDGLGMIFELCKQIRAGQLALNQIICERFAERLGESPEDLAAELTELTLQYREEVGRKVVEAMLSRKANK